MEMTSSSRVLLRVIFRTLRNQRRCLAVCPYRQEYYNHNRNSKKERSFIKLGVGSLPFFVAASFFGEQKEDKLKESIGKCTMHLHQSEPHLAVPHFEKGYEVIQEDLARTPDTPVPPLNVVYLMDQLGNIALQLERYREAVELYAATVNGLALNGIERSNRTVTELFMKIGQIHAILGQFKDAEMTFMHCINVLTAELNTKTVKSAETVHMIGLSYEGLGKVYHSMAATDNAINMYKHAIQYYQSDLEHNNPQLPVLLNDLATVYESIAEYDKALEHVEAAIDKASLYNTAILPSILCNKATILMYQGNLGKAEELYNEVYQQSMKVGDHETLRELRYNMKILEDKMKGT